MNFNSEVFQKQWFVIYTNPRAEKKVSQRLDEKNIKHLLPLKKELRQWKDRKKWIEVVLFPSYIFVLIEDCKRFDLYSIPGFLKFVTFEGEHTTVKSSEIDKIERLCSYTGLMELSSNTYIIGAEVLITSGHFIGIRGKIADNRKQDRLRIQIEIMNWNAVVEIDKLFIEKII